MRKVDGVSSRLSTMTTLTDVKNIQLGCSCCYRLIPFHLNPGMWENSLTLVCIIKNGLICVWGGCGGG